jgi:hypothetical protein
MRMRLTKPRLSPNHKGPLSPKQHQDKPQVRVPHGRACQRPQIWPQMIGVSQKRQDEQAYFSTERGYQIGTYLVKIFLVQVLSGFNCFN